MTKTYDDLMAVRPTPWRRSCSLRTWQCQGSWRSLTGVVVVCLVWLVVSSAQAQSTAETPAYERTRVKAQLLPEVPVTVDGEGALHFGPRVIPLPKLISPEARKALIGHYAHSANTGVTFPWRDDDEKTWKKMIATADAAFAPMVDMMLKAAPATVERNMMGGVTVYVGKANRIAEARKHRAIMRIHGGAFVMLSDGKYAMALAAKTAVQCGCTAFSVNYRTPPDHPYPAAIDDAVAVYREMLKAYKPEDIAIEGESAGGNLAAAVTLKIRDLGLPMPAMVILLTPAVDLTLSGDSFYTNMGLDGGLKGRTWETVALYAGGHDRNDPYISPVFGDFNKGFPPTFIQSGTRDLLLSSSVLMHRALRRAGIDAELHVWEGMGHGAFAPGSSVVPEDREIESEIEHFVAKHWDRDR